MAGSASPESRKLIAGENVLLGDDSVSGDRH